ncbi:MAG: hypothetical protein QG597_484, partial [Actinomycetota bacterium]|nr:hypothetical protein [Actinomycetota bacterium]
IERVSGVAGVMWDAFSAMPPEAQQTLATLAVLDATGVIDVKLMVTPMLSAGVGGVLASIFTGAAAAVSIPVTIGIAAYVGAVTWVWNQEWYEEPRRLVETTMNMVFSDGITAGLADVPGVMWAGLWQAFIVPWQTMWQFMGEVASNAWAAITSTITTALTNAGTSIGVFGANIIGGLAATWSQIQGEASAAWNRVLTGVQSYLQFIEMGMEQFSASITGTVSGAWANVQQVTTGALAAIGNAVSGAVGFIGSLWSGAWSAIAGATSSVMDLITGRIGQGLGAIQGLFEGAVSAIGAIWGRVADVVRAPIAAMFGWINSNMIGPINDVLGKFSDAVKLGTLPTFHTGGFTGDQLSNREGLALLRNDEYVMGPEATARNRPLLEALNAGRQGFGIGGPFDIIGDIVGDIAGLVARGASAVMSTVSAPLIGALRSQFGGDWSPNVVIGGMDHVLGEVGKWATARDAKAAAASALATASGGFIGPASGLLGSPLNPYVVTSEFGDRGGVLHAGIDLGAPTGQPIMAAGAGKVMQAGWNDGYGNYAALDHGGGLWSTYGHMSALASTAGQVLSAGQVLGYVGSTGDSTGPHLHFETRQDGNPINPRSFFAFDQGGYLPPGASAVWNGTGKPEPVFTADQWGKIKDRPIVVQVLLDGRQMHEAQVRYLRDAGVSA